MAPDWLNGSAVARLLAQGVYVIRTVDGVAVAEPSVGKGPAYAQDYETGWWQYLYDVAVAC